MSNTSKLNATDRKEYKKLIETKQQNLISALNGELFRNKEDLTREALYAQKYTYDSEELAHKIRTIDDKINDVVSEFLLDEEAMMEVQVSEACQEIDRRINEFKMTYATQIQALQDEKKSIRTKIIGEHTSLVDKIAKEKVPDLLVERDGYKVDIEEVKKIENAVKVEIDRKVALVRKMRYRIQSAINDKINELFESLINCETREEAGRLLASVPTIAELINGCETPEGLAGIVQKLSPSLALPAPVPPPEPVVQMKQAVVSKAEYEDDDDDEEGEETSEADEPDTEEDVEEDEEETVEEDEEEEVTVSGEEIEEEE